MRIHIDIAGQIAQKGKHSAIGFMRSDGLSYSVVLPSNVKRKIISDYKGQITNLVEKIYSILVYYCIRDHLEKVEEIVICRDVNPRKVSYLLPFLFKDNLHFDKIKIRWGKNGKKSKGHWPALKAYRSRKQANIVIKKEMIKEKLFEFK